MPAAGRNARLALIGIAVAALAAVAIGLDFTQASAADDSTAVESSTPAAGSQRAVSALGRLQPDRGVIQVAAPAVVGITSGVVMHSLEVDEGDDVVEGQLMAVTDIARQLEAAVLQADAGLELARRTARSALSSADAACVQASVREKEADRREQLWRDQLASLEESDRARGDAQAARADCAAAQAAAAAEQARVLVSEAAVNRARADLQQAYIHAPSAGRVLKVLSWPGELIGRDGAFEIGRVERMFAVAEVYESDIGRVALGQRASVASPALSAPLGGVVERIHRKVEKQDVIGTDPAARKDARIVEVEILLDDPAPVVGLTNLQVTVVIGGE
jgi:HlyD family secretion protein